MTPQAYTVLDHLTNQGSLTRVEAENVYRIRQLPARIKDLRDAGFAIETELRNDATGQRYARYHLTGVTQ